MKVATTIKTLLLFFNLCNRCNLWIISSSFWLRRKSRCVIRVICGLIFILLGCGFAALCTSAYFLTDFAPLYGQSSLPVMDIVFLSKGGKIEGVILDVSQKKVRIQAMGKTETIALADVSKIVYREERYLSSAKNKISNHSYEEALKSLDLAESFSMPRNPELNKESKELIDKVYTLLASEGKDVVVTKDGIRLIGVIVEEKDDTITLQVSLGKLHLNKGNIRNTYFKEALILKEADRLLDDKKYEDALSIYEKIQKNTLQNSSWKEISKRRIANVYERLGDDYQDAGKLKESIQAYQNALHYTPDSPIVLQKLKNVDARYTDELNERRKNALTHQKKGDVYLGEKNYNRAYREFSEALNLDPDLPRIKEKIESCLDNMHVLYYGDFEQPLTLEPVTATKLVEKRICQLSFESLVTRDMSENFIFSLASGLDVSPDGLSYTFFLKKGVHWSNGRNFTARDVAFTLRLLLNPKTSNYNPDLSSYIEDVTILNPYTLTITMKRPFYRPLSLLSFQILPCDQITENYLDQTNSFTRNPVCTGPFLYQKGFGTRVIEFGRNPYFHKKDRPFLQGVTFKEYQDRQSARNDLERGEIQLLTELRPLDVDFFEKQQGFVVQQYKSRTIYFLACNHRNPLLSNLMFRKALIHAIDRRGILEQYFNAGNPLTHRGGQAHTVITGPFPSDSWAYNDSVEEYPYDPFYAQTLLKECLTTLQYKRKDGQFWVHPQNGVASLSLKFPKGDRNVEKACIHIADSFKKLGIKVRLALKAEKDLYDEVINQHDFDLVYTKYTFDNTLDVFPIFDPKRTDKGETNFSGYVNPKLIQLFYSLHNTLNPASIKAISQEIHKTAHEEVVHLFLWQLDLYAAHVSILKNVKVHPYLFFNFVEDWRIIKE